MALETAIRREGRVTIVTLRGKVTLGEASQSLRTTAETLVDEGCPHIVLNLVDVPFIDSAGLGALTLAYTKAKAAGGMVKLAAATPRVRDAIQVTMLDRLFPLYPSEQEAVESFDAAGERKLAG